MEIFIVLGVMGLFLFVGVFWFVDAHNDIIKNENRAKRAWSDVVAEQVKKLKVIPALADAMKEYKEFEAATFAKITELRSSIGRLSEDKIDVSQLARVESLSQQLFSGLKVTVENYPNLKASDLYGKYMKELSEIQDNITSALRIYNEGVERFNNGIQQFPSSIVNSMWNKEVPLEIFSDSAAQAEFEYKPNF